MTNWPPQQPPRDGEQGSFFQGQPGFAPQRNPYQQPGMEADERAMFLEELGIEKSGLDTLITACYHLLGLISFLTAGSDECRAWTIKRGTKAPQAAGKIHTDFERGFIRAEIVPFETLQELGSMNACREKGLIRSEGKDYVMQDGDVTLFRFNV